MQPYILLVLYLDDILDYLYFYPFEPMGNCSGSHSQPAGGLLKGKKKLV